MHLAFLHTAPGHVATFDGLVRASHANAQVDHGVDAPLLQAAQVSGANDPQVVAQVHEAMHRAAAGGAGVVVCTCSTLGGAAESMDTGGRFVAQRIDRAMADRAVTLGRRVMVVAALPSTLEPTRWLLADSARSLGVELQPVLLSLPQAWGHFVQGDLAGYIQAVVTGVRGAWREAPERAEVVVLAQASMAPAAALLGDLGVEVLSSPALGVAQALRVAALRPSSGGPIEVNHAG
jgi:hypothetical protein